jgi:predicted phosphodiesterase
MKILATADLHIGYGNSETIETLSKYVKKEQPDVVVIAGDVYDYRDVNPNYELSKIDDGIQFVYCLGNHEFAYRSPEFVFNHYKYNDRFENVHCLDIKGKVNIDGVRFVGNVLWYDGSLSNRNDVNKKLNNIDESWLDSTIYDFFPVQENKKCIYQIKNNLENYNGKSVLVTHTVPYWKLNQFNYDTPNGVYNIYSGVYDLFKNNDVNVDVAICGHTHRPVRVEYNQDNKYIRCYNIGNDYFSKTKELKYEIIEI